MGNYGGSFNKHGRISQLTGLKVQFRTEVLLDRLVRFDLAKAQGRSLLSDVEIGKILNRSVRSIVMIRRKIPYLKKRVELMTGINTDHQELTETSINKHKQMLRLMLPTAMRVIYDAAQGPMDATTTLAEKKFRVEVAKDILDREGSFPRISRTDSHVKHEHKFDDMDGISKELLDSIDVPLQEEDPALALSIQNKITASKAFTQTETLSSELMEASITALETLPVEGRIQ